MNPLIECKNIIFDYEDAEQSFRALNEVSFTIHKAEYIAIRGVSGSGKSTLLNVLGLLASSTSGDYLWEGVSIKDLDQAEQARFRGEKIGFVFQHFNLLPRLTALENVLLPVVFLDDKRESLPREHYVKRAEKLLADFGIADKSQSLPSEMSGGQKQRVAICRALLLNPSLILADEPTGALDAATTKEVLSILEHLNSLGKTVIVITHDPAVAGRAKRSLLLKDGKIIEDKLNPLFDQFTDQLTDQPSGNTLVRSGMAPELSSNTRASKFSIFDLFRFFVDARYREVLFALQTLRSHPLRSFLTGLGLFIGITSLVFVAGLGVVSERAFEALFLSPATQKVYVMQDVPHGVRKSNSTYWAGMEPTREFPTFAARFASLGKVRPLLGSETCTVVSESQNVRARFQGIFDIDEYKELDTPLSVGRFPTNFEMEEGVSVVVLGKDAVDDLFKSDYRGRQNRDFPVGEKIAATNCDILQTFVVIGVLEKQDLAFMRTDADNVLYVPVPALLKSGMQKQYKRGVSAMPNLGVDSRVVADTLANYLSSTVAGRVEFRTVVPQEMLDKVRTMLLVLQGLTSFIGFLCIFVGGIGIMNIMLVSVRERIREIGLSKSIGATPMHIQRLFLTESVTLCVVFGMFGIFAGFALNNLVAWGVVHAFPSAGKFEIVYAWFGNFVAVLVSVGCGIGFGLLPAFRARNVNPAECLREE